MDRFLVEFVKENGEPFALEYEVLDHSLAAKWFTAFKEQNVSNLRPQQDVFHNFDVSEEFLSKKIKRLDELIDLLNTFVDKKLVGRFDKNDIDESLNRLHIHFPAHHGVTSGGVKHNLLLSEYNDLIHIIQNAYYMKDKFKNTTSSNEKLMMCFKSGARFIIETEEFKHFTIKQTFGDVLAHYPHVGRHPFEIWNNGDINIPENQIIPQREVTSDSAFRLGSNFLHAQENYDAAIARFKVFYNRYGASRWPYKLDDPRLALGSPVVARLVKDYGVGDAERKQYTEPLKNATLVNLSF